MTAAPEKSLRKLGRFGWLASVTLVSLGLLGDFADWWSNRPFFASLISSIAIAALAVAVGAAGWYRLNLSIQSEIVASMAKQRAQTDLWTAQNELNKYYNQGFSDQNGRAEALRNELLAMGRFPDRCHDEVLDCLARLDKLEGPQAHDPLDPLIWSVRSLVRSWSAATLEPLSDTALKTLTHASHYLSELNGSFNSEAVAVWIQSQNPGNHVRSPLPAIASSDDTTQKLLAYVRTGSDYTAEVLRSTGLWRLERVISWHRMRKVFDELETVLLESMRRVD